MEPIASLISHSDIQQQTVAENGGFFSVALEHYAEQIGLAYQIVDDILDVSADSTVLGKTPGKDKFLGKATYVSLHGIESARALVETYRIAALESLRTFGTRAHRLHRLAESLTNRVA
ncbi:polyprenyl synthetase family protein [Paraburkholderia sp. MM6662-R1]|uniref:polyprenyl synthetase family protein n=1 Tax=Paraburkholderia sp. MM6662-R1 TaxID=2991066 RepID=UPI003D1AFB35